MRDMRNIHSMDFLFRDKMKYSNRLVPNVVYYSRTLGVT